jgi:hypothetical protein
MHKFFVYELHFYKKDNMVLPKAPKIYGIGGTAFTPKALMYCLYIGTLKKEVY